ncbi:orotate phosphoribosyltransferase [Bifidobacterium jacchi]|uniref:Orotate phosphoribosyltransferase n=1 Tax=Bifidobacterium jacchi TaxID=2490545 RepID=A0A5N5RKK2_9BIFI|nr:orotate phosphoribosyltransferase [Bifidobacterium jacchi]KAB5607836.1 orotate phosphoribosyltransferase [Bifidobacterium jacchi]
MSEQSVFRKTGAKSSSANTGSQSGAVNGTATVQSASEFTMLDPRNQLASLLRQELAGKPFCELSAVTLDHRGAGVVGHLLLDALEEQGYSVDDFDAVGALTAAAVPLVCAMIQAAASRGEDLDGFIMDFVYPSIKGPSIAGKRVILLDSWLSEKSYVQTSSLVTLRNGNELSLDFSVVEHEGATVLAVASLIGGVDMTSPHITVVNPVNGEKHDLPFIEVFKESELR